MINVGTLAQRAGDMAIAILGGNHPITLRSRAVARDQVHGLTVSTLAASGAHAPGAAAITLSCRALDGELPAGVTLRVTATGVVYTVFEATRLQPPTATVPIVGALSAPLADTQALEIVVNKADTDVPSIRRDEPSVETEAGVTVAQSVYQVSTTHLPLRIDTTWLVVDAGIARRITQVQPLRAGGLLHAWRIFAEGAG